MELKKEGPPEGLKNQYQKRVALAARQMQVLIDELFYPDKPITLNGEAVTIDAEIDASLFEEAVRLVVNQTDTLRVGLSLDRETFYAEVRELPFTVDRLDLSSAEDPESAATAWIEQAF